MPTISLRKAVYDECVRNDVDPTEFANEKVAEALEKEFDAEVNT